MVRACLCVISLLTAACSFSPPSATPPSDGPPPDDDAPPPDTTEAPACDLGATWADGKQPATTLHVSPIPGPGTPDGSQTNPFTTVEAALVAATPGTRILLAPGSYAGARATTVAGTEAAPIWIEGPATGGRATITGARGLHLVSPRYVVIRHLDFTIVAGVGLNLDDGAPADPGSAHHVVIDDVGMTSVAATCFQLTGVDDVVLRDSRAVSCNRGVMMVGVHRAQIARLQATSLTTAGVAMAGGSEDIEVRQSTISTTNIGIWIGGESTLEQFRPALTEATGNTEARNIRVFDNVIAGAANAVVCTICRSSLVAHNLIRDATLSVFRTVQSHGPLGGLAFAPAGDVTYVNNAIEAIGAPAEMIVGPDTDGASLTFRHNLWDRPTPWMPMLPTQESMGVYDRASGYTLEGRLCAGANGAAAGAGTALPEVPGTLQGACRPSPPSIGPSEPDPGC